MCNQWLWSRGVLWQQALSSFGIQLPTLSRMGLLVRPQISAKHPGVRRVGVLLIPAVLAASVGQINALVNTVLASTLTSGSIAWLYYADRLLELPVGLVAVALGTVMLPHLSAMVARGDAESFKATLSWGVGLGLMLALPAAVALYLFAQPLLAVLFMSFSGGAMTALDIRMSSYALEMFAIALPGFCGGQSFVTRFLCAPRHPYTLSLCDCRCRGQFGRQLGNFSDDGAYRVGYGDGFVRLDSRRAALHGVASTRPVSS